MSSKRETSIIPNVSQSTLDVLLNQPVVVTLDVARFALAGKFRKSGGWYETSIIQDVSQSTASF